MMKPQVKKPIIYNGKQYDSIEDLGKTWWEEKKAENWQRTPVGYLPPEEVALSGMVRTSDGQWAIPGCEYIAEQTTDSLRKGQKYIGPTKQFLNWKRRYFPEDDSVEDYAIEQPEQIARGKAVEGDYKYDGDDPLLKEVMDLL
jgi:hypothetical protein